MENDQAPNQPQPGEESDLDATAPVIEPAAPVIEAPATPENGAADTAAPETAVDTTAATTPEIGSEAWLETASPAELRAALDAAFEQPAAPSATPQTATQATPAPAAETPAAGTAIATAEPFTFSDGADFDTFRTEASKYREMIEVTPELDIVLNRYESRLAELETATPVAQAQADESVQRHMGAFDELVTFVKDPDLDKFVPNTGGLITLLTKEYGNELPQVIRDLNGLSSGRYPGLTLFQEFLKDYGQLDDAAMQRLDFFLHNHGRLEHPAFVPDGIHPSLAEAYWTSDDRDKLQEDIERCQFTLKKDAQATQAEKEKAKAELTKINTELSRVQRGLNADRERADAIKAQQKAASDAIQNEAVDNFVATTRKLVKAVGAEAAKGLQMMDEVGGGLVGLALGTVIENAFSDQDGYAKFYQQQLKDAGVEIDWTQAYQLRDKLFETEMLIVSLQKSNAHSRAIENAKKDKDTVIAELQGLARQAGGKINAKVIAGAGKKLADTIKNAPKTVAARVKTGGNLPNNAVKPNFDEMSPDEIRTELRKMRQSNPYAAAAFGGDTSGFVP